jgi:hypothetical protein
MSRGGDYYMLMASLPAMPRRFDAGPPPITLMRLQDRWAFVGERDRALLERVASFLLWDRQPLARSDTEVIRAYDELMAELTNPVVREIVAFRMDVRTLVAGLRRRRLGQGPPAGVGQWVDTIRRNWARPDFGLGKVLPWLPVVARLLEANDTREAERAILGVVWDHWIQLADRQDYFSFESLAVYLARRNIVMRWAHHDPARGKERFDRLVTEALGEHANLFDAGDRDGG